MVGKIGRHVTAVRFGKRMLQVAGVAVAVACMAGAAAAKDFRYSFGFPTSFATYPSIERYAAAVEKATGHKIKVFATNLLTPAETMAGLRDGLADIGWDSMPYNPVDFSEGSLVADLSMLVTSGNSPKVPGAAMTGAALEYILLNCPECLEQFKARNVVHTAGTGTTPYYLICNKKLTTLADMKGRRIRVAAGNFERWTGAVGASGISMPGNETYDALSQGVLDCSSNDLSQLTGQRLVDVGKFITNGVPGGVYGGSTIANWNRAQWKGLSAEHRAAILRIGARFSADSVVMFNDATQKSIDASKTRGATFFEAADDLKAATAAFVNGDKATIEKQYTEKYGLKNVGAKVAKASELIEKWKKLTLDTPSDVDALEKLYWEHVYSKLDLAKYGMD